MTVVMCSVCYIILPLDVRHSFEITDYQYNKTRLCDLCKEIRYATVVAHVEKEELDSMLVMDRMLK